MNRFRIKRSGRTRPVMGMVSQQTRDQYGEPYLLSQDEVTHRLAISRTTLWRLIKQQEFETVHIGSRTYVTASSLNDFLARRTTK